MPKLEKDIVYGNPPVYAPATEAHDFRVAVSFPGVIHCSDCVAETVAVVQVNSGGCMIGFRDAPEGWGYDNVIMCPPCYANYKQLDGLDTEEE